MKSEDKEMQNRLFSRMRQEFGERGVYAVEMLQTAERLLEQTEQAPRQASAAAYCIRQAAVEIFQKERNSGDSWRVVSRDAVDAKRRFIDSPNPKDDLPDLLSAVDRLAKIHDDDTTHQGRLREAIKFMTGDDPLTGESSPLKEHQGLIEALYMPMHDVKDQSGAEDVRAHYNRAIHTLARILLPSNRQEVIAQLAELHEPQSADAKRLKEVMVSPNDFDYFASRMKSAAWFKVMDRDMLKPPSGSSPWLVRHIVSNLKDEHLDAFISLVNEYWDDWTADEAGLDGMGFVGFRLGDHGLPFLAKALEKKPESRPLCGFAALAYSRTTPSNPWIAKLADLLLNPASALDDYNRTDTIPTRLVDGMNRSSSEERIAILVFKLAMWLECRDLGYLPSPIADIDRNAPPVTNGIVRGLCDALKKGRSLGMPTLDLVGQIARLPEHIRSRFEAWLYSHADDVDCSTLVDFVVSSCRSRHPAGEDVLLLDRLGRQCTEELSAKVAGAIGSPPDPEEVDGIMRRDGRHEDDLRRILWAATIGDGINLPGWEPCLKILGKRGWNRDSISHPVYVSVGSESPFGREEFDSTDPYAMAAKIKVWRPDAERSLGSAIAIDIANELEDAVKSNPDRWAEDPVRMIKILQHPTYVAGYFRGLARSEDSLDPHADKLIRATGLAVMHPWPAIPLGSLPYEYDPDWQNADNAGIDLIGAIARKNARLSEESLSDAWGLVLTAATGRPVEPLENADPEAEPETDSKDHMQTAINRPRTNALQVALYLIQYVKNRNGVVPEAVLAMLTGALRLTGQDGAEHRAILASRTAFLRSALPDWFEQNERILFGKEAPGNLAQVSFDMHLGWDHPDKAILEKYRNEVLGAIERGIKRAMDRLLLGMFWDIDGYDPKSIAACLTEMGSKYVSLAGEHMAAILSIKDNAGSIPHGVSLWKCVLDSSPKLEALAGYGRWADVSALDQELWESLTLRTCKQTHGKLDRAGDVAKRIGSAHTVTDTGLKILKLLIQANPDYLDRYMVAENALNALRRSKDAAGMQESWNLLHEAMWERGFHQDV